MENGVSGTATATKVVDGGRPMVQPITGSSHIDPETSTLVTSQNDRSTPRLQETVNRVLVCSIFSK